jgi:arsenite oxidase small subunit
MTPPDPSRRRVVMWLWRLPVIAALAGAGYGIYEMLRMIFRTAPAEEPRFEAGTSERVAGFSDLPEVWASVEFAYAGTPAVLLRLPDPVPGGLSHAGAHFAAFSRVCTHQGCAVSLNRNLEAVAVAFNHRSSTPVLTCPCHLSVFDPLRAAQAVSGPAVLPLPRVRLERRGEDLYATGLEVSG